MIRSHNHEGIVGLQPSERNFRNSYKIKHNTTKGATQAYNRLLYSNNKQANIAKRQHLVKVLINCTPELNEQLMCEQLFVNDFTLDKEAV